MKEPSGERLDLRRVRVLVRQRLRQGRRRARAAFWPVVTAAVAAGLAWAVAFYALGHVEPFFAPVAAWVCLGFTADRQVRKVAELAIGVSLGVGFGELVAYFIGTGVPQIMLVIVVAALMARFVDRGHTLTIQAGVQGVVIVALPVVATDGATGRWTDALVGGAFALLVAVLTPRDARRRARQLAGAGFSDLAQMLDTIAAGIGDGDIEQMRDALAQGRGTQGTLDEWAEVVRNARQAARLSPAARRYVPELARLERASTFADRAMRNARVIARRGMVAVEQGARDDQVADAYAGLAVGARRLGKALGTGANTADAAQVLTLVAGELDPADVSGPGWHLQTLVILTRSLTVDLLQAAGLSASEASHLLAPDD
ncbi:MAG TPA: FUSC family protein [Actinomycetaceae bacterium]|nr:FUSC family protein [Actinomycetaceae bacterium]